MNKNVLIFLCCLSVILMFSSCGASRKSVDFSELAKAGLRLGMDIDYDDNQHLYIEASKWIGTPYRYGGMTRRGVDCSGFVKVLYDDVYGYELSRTADEQYRVDCKRVKRKKLEEGDLVFFKNARKSKKASHVGIYLKDNKFIHASTTQGVIVSSLDEPVYDKTWLSGGRVR